MTPSSFPYPGQPADPSTGPCAIARRTRRNSRIAPPSRTNTTEMTKTFMATPENQPTPHAPEAPADAAEFANDGAAPVAPRPKGDIDAARAFAIDAARLLSDDRCEDIVVLDVSGVSQVTDFIVVASGTSDRQMRGSADDVKKLAEARGFPVFRHSVDARTTWYVLDSVDVVTHVFEPNTRSHYDLEMLWGDVPRVEWERPEGKSRDHAGLND